MTAPAPGPRARPGGEALLWDLTDSPFCAKARMCLHLKGLPYRRVTLTVARLGELRRLSPRGQVPVLVHGARTIADSTAIARYLEAEVPGPPLLPTDPAARAYCELLEEWADEALAPLVGACRWVNPANRATAIARTVPELAGAWPRWLVRRALVLRSGRRYRASGMTRAGLDGVVDRLRANLATLAGLLGGRELLLGRIPTVADLAVVAQLASLAACHEGETIAAEPAVAAFVERMGAIPAIAAALA